MNFLLSKTNILILIMQIFLSFPLLFSNTPIVSDSEQQVSTFNQKFLSYQGTQSGSVVQLLISDIENSNQNSEHFIQILLDGNTSSIDPNNIGLTQKYNVYFGFDNSGYIYMANITTIQ